jgi:predicted secreted protein
LEVMNGIVRIFAFLLTATWLPAQATEPTPSPAPNAKNLNENEAPTAKDPATFAPKLKEQVDLSKTPSAESLEFPHPPGAPDPSKAPEITEPLPGDEKKAESIPVTDTISITAKENGRTVKAAVGNLIRITLESNPSTGFNWELRDFEFGAAIFYSSDLVARQAGNVLFGAPGDTVITLQAVKPGRQNITLVYRRQWEPPDQVAATFTFTLEVTPTP